MLCVLKNIITPLTMTMFPKQWTNNQMGEKKVENCGKVEWMRIRVHKMKAFR